MTPYVRAAALVRAEAESIRVDLYATDAEMDRLAREKGRLHMLARRIEDLEKDGHHDR